MQQNNNAKENKIQANLSDVMHACLVKINKKIFNTTKYSPRKSNPIPINDQ
jgi:hypothetical protein